MPNVQRKEELLDGVCGYLLEHGLAGLSLRPLAEALGTSPRMLLYHFGSKENLLREAFRSLRQQHQTKFGELGWNRSDLSIEQMLLRVWDWLNTPENEKAVRLSLEVGLHGANGSAELRAVQLEDEEAWGAWMEGLWRSHGWPRRKLRPLASLTVSTVHGLMLRAASTGDFAGGRKSLKIFASMLRAEMGEAW